MIELNWRRWIAPLAVLVCLTLCGCESPADRAARDAVFAYYTANYEQARVLLEPLAKQTNGDFVLNNDRLGSTTLAEYRIEDAESAFLRSYEVINSVGVNDGGRSLGAAIVSEDIKVWKGEPFERAMVNYYLGVIYYMRHDYGNARAAFENALFKLRDYTNSDDPNKYAEINSDFTLGYFMLGKCWQRLGDMDKAKQNFDEVAKLRPDLAALSNPDYNQSANLLLIVDWGYGPLKRTNGDGAFVGYSPAPWQAGPIFLPRVIVDGVSTPDYPQIMPPMDLLALAQDRRWESIDTIRAVKSFAGTGLMAAGVVEGLRGGRQNAEIGAGLFVAGLLLKASSHADLRQWEMLPRTSFVIPLHVPPGAHDVTVEFSRGGVQRWHGLIAPASGDNTYYMRMTPWAQGPYIWPPPPTGISASEPPPGSFDFPSFPGD